MKDLQLIKPKKLASLLQVSVATIYRWHKEGKIPIQKVKIGPHAVGYRQGDVEAWINGELENEELEK